MEHKINYFVSQFNTLHAKTIEAEPSGSVAWWLEIAIHYKNQKNSNIVSDFGIWKPRHFFGFSFHANLFFPIMNIPVYVDIHQGIH